MRPGPLALALLVLMATLAMPSLARAEDASTSSSSDRNGGDDDQAFCTRGEPERVGSALMAAPIAAFTMTLARARQLAGTPAGDPLVCVKRGLGFDCQVHDPASSPAPLAFHPFAFPDVAPVAELTLPEPDVARVAFVAARAAAVSPGFARGLFRPPRV
jgi:hypothetical protein